MMEKRTSLIRTIVMKLKNFKFISIGQTVIFDSIPEPDLNDFGKYFLILTVKVKSSPDFHN